MAAQLPQELAVKWKEGSLCDLYVRKQRKWNEGRVIGTFTNDQGDWVKVRCGLETHDVLCDDPDLRTRVKDNVVIPVDKMKALQTDIVGTKADQTLQWILKSTKQTQFGDSGNR